MNIDLDKILQKPNIVSIINMIDIIQLIINSIICANYEFMFKIIRLSIPINTPENNRAILDIILNNKFNFYFLESK